MNRIYKSIWNEASGTFVAASEIASSSGRKTSSATAAGGAGFALKTLAASILLAFGATSWALPVGGQVSAGSAAIYSSAGKMTINQSSQNVAINWQSFGIAATESVNFVQPNSASVALNRVIGPDPSAIFGMLSANGKIFLVNPNGILFGRGASVNVGGLAASTLNISDADFMAGKYKFSGASTASVQNQGAISAPGGYVALLGANVSNSGVISARLGSVALAAGKAVTLDLAGDGLLNVTVDQGAVKALVDNGGMIQADGGQVLLTAQAAGTLLTTVVNSSGIIQAQTVQNRGGKIRLLGDMNSGTVNVSGTLDASAPAGGDGGFVETSAAHVEVSPGLKVTTAAAQGLTGSWLVDPKDYTIAASGGDITGAALGAQLSGTNVTILSSAGAAAGSGNINVNDAVSWSANTLTLNAANNININAVMTASGTSILALNPATANGADAAVAGGTVNVGMGLGGFTGRVDFFQADGVTPRAGAGFFSIGGVSYTVISSLGQAGSVTGTDLQGMAGGLGGHYALGANIDASLTSTWNAGAGFAPIGSGSGATNFTGVFDGLGHTISNLTINRTGTTVVGLFGYINAGTIRNVGLVGASVKGGSYTGALAGLGYGGVVSNAYSTGSVSGSSYTGGLIGNAGYGGSGMTVSRSFSTAAVTGTGYGAGGLVGGSLYGTISNSFASGNVNGNRYVGGFVGNNRNGNTINNSYASGAVTGSNWVGGFAGEISGNSAINTSYSSGKVAGTTNLGGLVGFNNNPLTATVSNSFWDTTASAQATSAGGTGMSTAKMQQQANFTGWDFTNTWAIYNGYTYPLMRQFLAPLTVTANNAQTTYNGAAYSGGNGITCSSGACPGSHLFNTTSFTGTSQGAINAASYVLTPAVYSDQQGYLITAVSGVLTINPAALTVTANNVSKIYGSANPALGVSYVGFVNGETSASLTAQPTVSTTATTTSSVGTYPVTASGAVDANYTFNYVNGSLAVNKATLTETANAASMTYGGSVPSLSGSIAGFVNGDTQASATIGTLSFATLATSSSNAGSYAITGSGLTPNGNYAIVQAAGNSSALTVNPASLTVNANNVSKIYGSANPILGVSYVGFVNGDTSASLTAQPTVSTTATTTSNVGTYPVTASGAVDANYIISYTNGTMTVNKATLTETANAASMTYGGSVPSLLGSIAGFVNGDTQASATTGTLSFATPATSSSNTGSYAITGSGLTPNGNYAIVQAAGNSSALTVNPDSLTVTANDASRMQGEPNPAFTAIYSGFVNGDTPAALAGQLQFATTATVASPSGDYSITVSGQSSQNYKIFYGEGKLTVNPSTGYGDSVANADETNNSGASGDDSKMQQAVQGAKNVVGSIAGGVAGLNFTVVYPGVKLPPNVQALPETVF
jgi:filamentous hemagglutinin family protein